MGSGSRLKLGYKASAEQFGPQELLDFGVHAERRGFDSVMISDHFQPWRHTGGHAPFSFAWLAALGARTQRVTLGTSVVTPTFRYHPSVVAQAVGTIACLNPGRVLLGLGTGESLNEAPPLGIEWPEFRERYARLREAIQLIRRLWTEERVSFDGTYYRTQNATVYDRPEQQVPIYVAAGGPQMAKYAGRATDGFICTSGKGNALYQEQLLPAFAEGAVLSKRDPGSLEKMIEIKVSFDTDLERATAETRLWGALALTSDEKTGVEDPLELERLADALPVERTASRWLVSDDADTLIEQIGAYVQMGFTHLVFHAPGPDQRRFLDLFSERVLPALRAL